ncbi:hypothetical protein LTR64_001517 [Lithohypha guttulata]|uniref:uncharacterized protein n=1 Tax=Lithohypha guttulata TaxID=1690604 RepID=UPI002DE0E5EE|nr:hypothetical protein LTR51_003711 [Lithohypha guttulata]
MTTTVAILGATGKTGREVLVRLLEKKDVNIKIYVRSRSKLIGIFPNLGSNPRVSLFQGAVNDVDNMTKCLDGAQKIIFTLGENDNLPGVCVVQDAVKTILAALTTLRDRSDTWQKPRVLLLSSATWNPQLSSDRPAFAHWAIKNAFHHPYTDLRLGSTLLQEASSLVTVLLVQPNALIEDEPSGHSLSVERSSLSITYGDLAAAFVELLGEEYDKYPAIGASSNKGDNGLKFVNAAFAKLTGR